MDSSTFTWLNNQGHHTHRGMRYSVDALIEIIKTKPRPIESLDLSGWYTVKKPGLFGEMESLLVSPYGDEHFFNPANLKNARSFPVIICRRKRHISIVDGVHRIVTSIRKGQKSYACVVVTLYEMRMAKSK